VKPIDQDMIRRIQSDLIDSYDEEFEMELEDRTELGSAPEARIAEDRACRQTYFKELFRLQGERERSPDYRRNPIPDELIVPEVC